MSPQHLLHVAGTIGAEQVIVSSTGADYVFAPGYRLRSLGEVSDFVKQNQRLPEIPSANEMQEKGASLGEMQTKLLAKIEELTLYLGGNTDEQHGDVHLGCGSRSFAVPVVGWINSRRLRLLRRNGGRRAEREPNAAWRKPSTGSVCDAQFLDRRHGAVALLWIPHRYRAEIHPAAYVANAKPLGSQQRQPIPTVVVLPGFLSWGPCDPYGQNASNVTECTAGSHLTATPSFPSRAYPADPSTFDVVFTADSQASTGGQAMTCSFGGINVTWSYAVYVDDATPAITYLQQYPPNTDGSFYIAMYGYNLGPAPGVVSVCVPATSTCSDSTGNNAANAMVCISAGCGAVYGYWSDNQVNALISPGSQTWGSYDVFITSGGESPSIGFQFAPGGLSTNISNRKQVYQLQTSPPTPRIYQNGQDITGLTQTVVVGQQIALAGTDVGGPFTNQSWTLNGTYVGGYTPTPTNFATASAIPVDTTGQNLTFYFTDAGSGIVVTYTVMAPNGLVFSAATTFNVVKPVPIGANPMSSALGPAGVLIDTNNEYKNSTLAVHFGGGTGSQGMIFTTNYSPPTGFSGNFQWVQLINAASVIGTYTDGTQYTIAQCQNRFDGGSPASYPYSTNFATADSPAQQLSVGRAHYSVNESFTMWLMFQPSLLGAIAVPVANVNWAWSAEVSSGDGGNTWAFSSPPSATSGTSPGTPTTVFPTWQLVNCQ